MRLERMLEGLDDIEVIGPLDLEISDLTYDSRKVEPGSLFAALPGVKVDGKMFAEQAVKDGAVAVLCEPPAPKGMAGVTCILSREPRRTLARLAAAFFGNPSRSMVVVGVTGTNGKTTVTYLLESMARCAGLNPGVTGTVAYRYAGRERKAIVTTPESVDLQRMYAEMKAAGVDFVASEVSSHGLVQSRAEGVDFSAGAFTNLSRDHLDYHGDMESYLEAKRLLFSRHLAVSKGPRGPVAIFCIDTDWGRRLAAEHGGPKLTCATRHDAGAEVFPIDYKLDLEGIGLTLRTPKGDLDLRSKLIGQANLQNLVVAASTALALDLPLQAVVEGIEAMERVPGRMEPVISGNGPFVVVDYAHSPDAVDKALAALRPLVGGRLIAVFGCGGDRDREKRPLMGQAAAKWADIVVVTSDNPRSEEPIRIIEEIIPGIEGKGAVRKEPELLFEARDGVQENAERVYAVVPDRRLAIELAVSRACKEDTVAILGKGHEDYQIVGDERLHLDDREEAERALRKRT